MANKISFSNNVIPINQLDRKTRKAIENYYIQISNNIHLQISQLQTAANQNTSTRLQIYRLKQLQESIDHNLYEITGLIQNDIENNMIYISNLTASVYLDNLGLRFSESFAHLNNQIITNIKTGKLYQSDWNFSKAIWGQYRSSTGDIAKIVSDGIAKGKSAYDIAKDLETYVNPKARKPWDWGKVYPGTAKKIDYNAQRLARTMISHAYQQTIVEYTKNNPFAAGIEWRSALTNRTCEICERRHGQIYSANNIPIDHPNGLCTYIVLLNKSTEKIADELAEWVHGADNPALDKYAEHLTGFDFTELTNRQKII